MVRYLDKGYRADRNVRLICENDVKTNIAKTDSVRCVRTVPNTRGKFYTEDISGILAAEATVVAEEATIAATNLQPEPLAM